jgi:hypothetical protein
MYRNKYRSYGLPIKAYISTAFSCKKLLKLVFHFDIPSLSDYAGPDVDLVVSPVNNAVTPATQLTCLQLPTPDALTRLGDYGATFNGAFRAFFVPGPTLTSLADLPHRTI